MAVNPIFPPNTSDTLSDRDWETQCCLVWCCNSLNARAAYLLHLDERKYRWSLHAQSAGCHMFFIKGMWKIR